MNADARFTLAALRSAWSGCLAFNPTKNLREALLEKSSQAFGDSEAGEIASTSANGHQVTFARGRESVGAKEMVEVWTYLIELFDRAESELEVDGTAAENQSAINTQMETYLRPVTGYTSDWRYLTK